MNKGIFKWLLNNWRTFIEIGVVIWAIQGMYSIMVMKDFFIWLAAKTGGEKIMVEMYVMMLGAGVNILLIPLLFYFLSALLILYLLRKKDNPENKSGIYKI